MSSSAPGVHVSSVPLRFKFRSFDFITQWLMGTQTHGGSEIGETLYATARIQDADIASWTSEWTALAERVEARARHSLAGGHLVSARQSFLRAFTYRRAPLVYLNPWINPQYEAIYLRARESFLQAARLFNPPVQPIAIAFEGGDLPGYFARCPGQSGPRPTLIMLGGGDTFVEDLYTYIVPAAHARGYHALLVDLPGQGILPMRGQTMRADAEIPMRAVVDFALAQPEVDPERLAVYGISGGGYLAPRAAAHDPRIKAVIANAPLLSFYDHWRVNAGMERVQKGMKSPLFRLLRAAGYRPLLTALEQLQIYYWRWGVHSSTELLEASRDFVFDPAGIACPFLGIIGEHEYNSSAINQSWVAAVRSRARGPVEIFTGPIDEGANSHTLGSNLSLMGQVVFDWLDDTFHYSGGAA